MLDESQVARLDDPDGEFTARESLALEFAEKLAVDHQNVDDGFFDRMRTQFDDAEILELGMMAGQYIGFGRLLMVLDLTPRSCPID